MSGLPILTYHAIDTSEGVISTDPKWFAATLVALHVEGFRCVDLQGWIDAGRPEVDRGFALAFDDGLSSIRRAAEVIARFGFAATAFLVTGWMGRENRWPGQWSHAAGSRLLGWSELDDLHSAGFRFGAHTVNHPHLSLCPEQELEEELIGSRRAIEDRTGRDCRLFAYPYGGHTPLVREAVSRHFSAGFGTRLDAATGRQDPFALSRIDAYYLRSPRVLKLLLSGDWSRWLRLRRAARAVRAAIPLAGFRPGVYRPARLA